MTPTAVSETGLHPKRIHPIRTPEGISVPFEVAPIGDRARALLIDLALVFLATFALFMAGMYLGWLGQMLALLAGFLLQNFYKKDTVSLGLH